MCHWCPRELTPFLKYFTKNNFPSLLKYHLKQWQFTRILVTRLNEAFSGQILGRSRQAWKKNEDQTYARNSRHHEDPIKAPPLPKTPRTITELSSYREISDGFSMGPSLYREAQVNLWYIFVVGYHVVLQWCSLASKPRTYEYAYIIPLRLREMFTHYAYEILHDNDLTSKDIMTSLSQIIKISSSFLIDCEVVYINM